MSTRPKGYGLSRELADKVAAKYSQEDELEIVAWLCDMTRAEPPEEAGPDAFKVWLKDGTILCALMDILQPGVCKKPHDVSKIRLQKTRILVSFSRRRRSMASRDTISFKRLT